MAVPDPRYCCADEVNCCNQALPGRYLCRRCVDEGFHARRSAMRTLDKQMCRLCRNEHPEFCDEPVVRGGKRVHLTKEMGHDTTAACGAP